MADDDTVLKPDRPRADVTLAPGALVLHTYRVERLLNKGGMGEVYLARHAAFGTQHAIKVIKPDLITNPMVLELSQREAMVLRDIHHDAVVGYEGFLQDDTGHWYLCMEYVDGPSLMDLLERGPLSLEQVYRLRDRLVTGLAAAHARGVVHRAISPDNVILPEGRVENAKLIDFGIAKLTLPDVGTILANTFAGKLRYASPEQLGLFGGKVDARSDIYSLGLVLAAAARGKPLSMGYSYETACQTRQRVPELSDIPAQLRPQLMMLLQPDPSNRPGRITELLQRWPTPGPGQISGGRGDRRLGLIALGVTLALLLGGGIYWWRQHSQPIPIQPLLQETTPILPGGERVPPDKESALSGPTTTPTGERKPLLLPGKTNLYQRILTRPGAALRTTPTETQPSGQPLPPLSIFFVYNRRDAAGGGWLEVGAASQGNTAGWLRQEDTIAWKQTLTVAFTNPAGREPTLFFRSAAELGKLLQTPDPNVQVASWRSRIKRRDLPTDFPVVSIEPDTYVDPYKHFYLLPILDFNEQLLESGHYVRLLNVAAVTLQPGADNLLGGNSTTSLTDKSQLLKDYRAAIVFVVDTTLSMGPYLDRTRAVIRSIYQRLKQSPWGRNVSFGLIAFRNNVQLTPRLEYVSKVFATLADGRDEATFFNKANQALPATVSSQSFSEDVYAGIFTALRQFDWSGYAGRFIVLITDAGALEANDKYSSIRLGADRLRILAKEKEDGEVAIYALHLLTPEGRNNHDLAAAQYQTLTQRGEAGSLYFPVAAGSVTEFGRQVDALANSLVRQVEQASQGKLAEVPAGASELEQKTALVGRAMQLAYLGRVGEAQAPRLINAWIVDRDFANPASKTLEVRVLLTKNQLSDLQQTVQSILEAGERTRIEPKNFFAQLKSTAARLARDPENINTAQVRRLADIGLVGEWLEDLPYKSKIMEITEDDWLQWSFSQQREFLDELEEKLILYQKFHDDTDRWITLGGDRNPGDAVCSIPVDALP